MTNPVCLAAIGFALALALRLVASRRRAAWTLAVASGIWLWLWATPLVSWIVGAALEAPYLADGRVPAAESLPKADAIVLHGGSMAVATKIGSAGEMYVSADRVWMAARLWKAGKAPKIIATGEGARESTAALLADFGVPADAVEFATSPRNTEEEARRVAASASRALIVTSAWHMRRTLLMYSMYAPKVEAIPAPCDFENTLGRANGSLFKALLPNEVSLMWNCVSFHEVVGLLGYEILSIGN